MKRCATCRTPCREDEVFCAHCGAALLVEGGRVEEELPTSPAPAAELHPEAPAAVPDTPRRRFFRLSRRKRFLLAGGCLLLAGCAVALALRSRPAEGFQARPAALLSIWSRASDGSQCFYYDGEPVAGPEDGLIGLTTFLDGRSCLAMDTEGVLAGVVTAGGLVELNRPQGTMTANAPSADGSVFYCALAGGSLWRCPLPSGEPERLVEGCSVDSLCSSPSGDAVAYSDLSANGWYLLRENGSPETLPLPEEAAVFCVSDGGRYVYYTMANAVNTNGYLSTAYSDSFLYCWDGSASYLVGRTDGRFNALSNRTGDQLLLLGSATTYLVDGTRNWSYSTFLYPFSLLYMRGNTAGLYQWNSVGVLDCADLTQGYFVSLSGSSQALYRLEEGVLTTALEEFDQARLDAAGETLWYIRDDQLWQFRKGRSTLQWEDPGEDVQLEGVSPDGSTVLCRSKTGLWRLTAGGEPEQLSEVRSAYALWNGFYYEDGSQFRYAAWDGAPEVVEGLENITSISYTTNSPLEVELEDGSIWHVIDGKEPIRITDALPEYEP